MSTYRFIDGEKANHSIRTLCRVLRVSRSCFYEWVHGRTWADQADQAAVVRIRAVHRQSRGTYGSPRVTAELKAQGDPIGRRRVARLMRENELAGRPTRRFRGTTTVSSKTDTVSPNLLNRQFTVAEPNTAWVGDITYLPTAGGWVYLAVLIDLFSRKVVGWAIEDHMQTELCLKALKRAAHARQTEPGLLHHTDRGCQYTSGAYRLALADLGMVQSMSRKANCWDNAVAESFFGTLEQELVKDSRWHDLTDARSAVSNYIHGFYNTSRRHSTLGQISPIDFELHNQAA